MKQAKPDVCQLRWWLLVSIGGSLLPMVMSLISLMILAMIFGWFLDHFLDDFWMIAIVENAAQHDTTGETWKPLPHHRHCQCHRHTMKWQMHINAKFRWLSGLGPRRGDVIGEGWTYDLSRPHLLQRFTTSVTSETHIIKCASFSLFFVLRQ